MIGIGRALTSHYKPEKQVIHQVAVLPEQDRMASDDTYVRPPRPIEVKKLIEKRVFFGSSRGKMPSNASASVLKWTWHVIWPGNITLMQPT